MKRGAGAEGALDGLSANFRCILPVGDDPAPAARALLAELGARPEDPGLAALRGKALTCLGRLPEARAALEESLRRAPDHARAWAWLGEVDLLETRFEAALGRLGQALALEPALPWASFFRAASLYALRRADEARKTLAAARRRAGPDERLGADAFLALLEAEAGRPARALPLADAAVRAARGAPWARALRARVLRLAGKAGDAAADWKALGSAAAAPWMLLERASWLETQGRLAPALADLAAAGRRGGESADLFLRRAALEVRRGRAGSAARELGRAWRLASGPEQARAFLLSAAAGTGSPAQVRAAEACVTRALSRSPGDAELRLARARLLAASGRAARAEAEAFRLLSRAPSCAAARLFLADRLTQRGRHERARGVLEEGLARAPGDADLLGRWEAATLSWAAAALGDGRAAEAAARLRAGLARLPGSVALRARLADALCAAGAEDEAERALRGGPAGAPELSDRLAEVLARRGAAREAAPFVKALLGRKPPWRPEDRVRILAVAASLRRAGRASAAAACYRRLVAREPGDQDARLGLAETAFVAGDAPLLAEASARPADRNAAGGPADRLARFELALWRRDPAAAARAGEELLDATRRFEHLQDLCRPKVLRPGLDRPPPAGFAESFRAAVERHAAAGPRSAWGSYFRATFYGRLRLPMDARTVEEDQRVLADLPSRRYGWTRYAAGLFQLRRREFKRAAACFAQAASFPADGDWRSQCHRGEALLLLGDAGGAFKALEEARAMAGPRAAPQVRAWEGELLLWVGRHAEAVAALDAIADKAMAPLAWCWRGAALACLGRTREALASVEAGLAAQPDDLEARIWRAELLLRLGRAPEAERAASALEAFVGRGGGPDDEEDVSRSFIAAIKALARGRLGRSLREGWAALPPRVQDFARTRAGRAEPASESDLGRCLEAFLAGAGGLRRGGYETSLWLPRLAPTGRILLS